VQLNYGLVSVDDHVQEHPGVWTSRLSRERWGERIPHVESLPNGTERWVVDGKPLGLDGIATAGAVLPKRTDEPQRWSDVPREVYEPGERLKAMDRDGVDYSVLYPTVAGVAGESFGRIADPELEQACVQAYNDWLIDEWASTSERFVSQCIAPISSVEAAIAEVHRAVGKGHRGLVFPSIPMELREVPHLNEAYWDPLWSTLEELEIPLCLHAGASASIQAPADENLSPILAETFRAITRPASQISIFVDLLLSRILLRHPRMRVVFAESGLGWGAYLLEFTDHQFEEDQVHTEGYELIPSEMFKRQCYLTGWYDRAGIQNRHFIGLENILWSTNFPLATSSWPDTKECLAQSFADVPDAERDQILWGNAAKLYRL